MAQKKIPYYSPIVNYLYNIVFPTFVTAEWILTCRFDLDIAGRRNAFDVLHRVLCLVVIDALQNPVNSNVSYGT